MFKIRWQTHLIGSLILLFSLFCFQLVVSSQYSQAFLQACDLVIKKYFQQDQNLEKWASECREEAQSLRLWRAREGSFIGLRQALHSMEVSHLDVYNPVEEGRMWKGQDRETGIRTRWIEDRFVVVDLIEGGPGAKSGVLLGDVVLAIDGSPIRSSWSIQKEAGKYTLLRGDQEFELEISTEPLQIDEGPTLNSMGSQLGYLKVTSFRGEYFEDQAWRKLARKFDPFDRLIVDLRGNPGGNFVAMMRALSVFICQPMLVGSLELPQRPTPGVLSLPNNMNELDQIELLQKVSRLDLVTFEGYPCYKGEVRVLVDSQSASVTEIFAEALRTSDKSKVYGQATAGDVVLAVWYALPLFGPGFSLSIPEALFVTPEGESLEGIGVWPDQVLDYQLGEALQGKDSFVLRAMEN